MCFYDNYRYACSDYKWGNFRQHCQSEYRIGETCGSRLVYETILLSDKCTMCEKIDRKHRRLRKLEEDYNRWKHDPQRQASKAKASDEIIQLKDDIQKLLAEKSAKQMRGLTSRRG